MKKTAMMAMVMVMALLLFIPSARADEKTDGLKSRITAHWQAKQEKDWEKAYGFFCNAYKADKSREDYCKMANLEIAAFSVEDIQMGADEKTATVKVRFEARAKGYQFPGIRIPENWIYEQDNWYVCPRVKTAKSMFQN